MEEKGISRAVIKRLPRYYRYLGELLEDGVERISSGELSERMKVTASQRFRSGRQVTAYFGLAPKQRSSADSVRLGGISGAGNALVRRLAVEGSWSYVQASHQPKLMPKGSGVPLEVRMHGRKGSERLLRRREEMLARGMPQAKANAATAAELVRWLWALGAMCREATE